MSQNFYQISQNFLSNIISEFSDFLNVKKKVCKIPLRLPQILFQIEIKISVQYSGTFKFTYSKLLTLF